MPELTHRLEDTGGRSASDDDRHGRKLRDVLCRRPQQQVFHPTGASSPNDDDFGVGITGEACHLGGRRAKAEDTVNDDLGACALLDQTLQFCRFRIELLLCCRQLLAPRPSPGRTWMTETRAPRRSGRYAVRAIAERAAGDKSVARTCGRRHFYGPLPVGSLRAAKSDRLLARRIEAKRNATACRLSAGAPSQWVDHVAGPLCNPGVETLLGPQLASMHFAGCSARGSGSVPERLTNTRRDLNRFAVDDGMRLALARATMLVHRTRARAFPAASERAIAPALGLLIGLGGCAPTYHGARASHFVSGPPLLDVATDHAASVSLPSDASSPAADAAHDDGTAIPVRLPQVIRACVLSDPRILAALESVEQARADHMTAGLLPNPSLMVSQTLVPFPGSPFDAESRQGGPPQFDIGLSYSLDTLIFGTRSAAMEATRLGVDVAFAEYADVARQRILEAIHAYYDVLEAREQLGIAREEAEQLDRLYGITERRVQLGGVGQVELDRMRVALAGGRRRLLRAAAELDNAKSRLRARFGRAAFANRADAEGTLEIDSPPSPPDLRSAMQLAEERRPDLLALKRQVARASADLTLERRTAWPSLSVSAGYTRQFQEQAIGFPDANSWGAGIEMSLPIFDRNQGNIARAQSAVRQADLLVSAARIDLRAELEQAIRDYDVAYQLVTALDEEALNAAAYVRQRVEEAYRLGGSTLLEVLEAQSAFRDVYGEHIAAHADLLRALHSLNATVGTEILR